VPLAEVLYLEADNIHTTVVTPHRKYAVRLSLSHLLERLQYDRMVRIHRSFVVNMDRIDSFSEHEVMIGTHSIPLGRNFKDNFMQHFPI
ncbi:LytR/AlgR family response regulator transcription factor, partial [Klebsiella pneumoniae]